MNTAEKLVECLIHEGVEVVFGIPGEENLEVMEALATSPIRFITVRHEQGAAFMADVYGRLTGKAGVCLATLGPGATNLITGVADANSDGAPLIAITGQVSTERMHITGHQYLDLTKIFEPVTKRSKMVVKPETICEIVRLAFKYAQSEKMGATHIDLPVDVARMQVGPQEKPITHRTSPAEYSDQLSLEKAAAMINQAKNPMILVGANSASVKTSDSITAMANQLHLPVINTMMAKGVIPSKNPFSMGTIGIPQRDFQDLLLEQCDLLLCVGYDLVELAPSRLNPRRNKQIIHLNTTAAHVNKYYCANVEIIGDIPDSLNRLTGLCRRDQIPPEAIAIRKNMLDEHPQEIQTETFPPKPQQILHEIRAVLSDDDILISDVGAHKMWIARHYECEKPRKCIISNGFASMGIALPGAIAARFVDPKARILAATGDGGFMMNMQELETARRENLPIVVLIFRDNAYGLIAWKQKDRYGHTTYTDFTNPDFVALAESMGCKGYRLEEGQSLRAILEDAFRQQIPAVIDCPVNYRENELLSQRLAAFKKENQDGF